MRTKSKFLTLLLLSAGATTSIAAINKCIKISATSKNLLSEPQALCYKWRLGDVYYTKAGSGKPLLLIHDIHPAASGHEWKELIPYLQENYTVYTIDLLGCGRSEKVNMTYTNYLYVQLITDFIKSVIGHRTNVITSGQSASIPVMACASHPELFDQLMLINPLSLLDFSLIPNQLTKLYKMIIELPVIGTLIYHIASSKHVITEELTAAGFYNPFSVKPALIDKYYEAAHLGKSPKSIYASTKSNFTRCNITNAIRKINNSLYVIGGDEVDDIETRLDEYKECNPAIETATIPETKLLPHLESAEALFHLIETYFS